MNKSVVNQNLVRWTMDVERVDGYASVLHPFSRTW